MRISDWSSDVCSSDLDGFNGRAALSAPRFQMADCRVAGTRGLFNLMAVDRVVELDGRIRTIAASCGEVQAGRGAMLLSTSIPETMDRSEEHTSELPSLMRISYAVFCLNKKKHKSYIQKKPTTPISQYMQR